MKRRSPAVFAASLVLFFAADARSASEIVVAIRYLQAQGVSHSHLYLYRDDGKVLRQLTNDKSSQDVDPIFAPDGTTIVFSREKTNSTVEFWSIEPLGGGLKKLDSAPDWYEQSKTSAYFTNRDVPKADQSPSPPPEESASPAQSGLMGGKQTYKTPDGSIELILREDTNDPDDQVDGEHHGKHYLIHYLKTGLQADFGTLPGFFGVYEILHERQDPDRVFLIEGLLKVAFFGLHLNSTDGDTCSALDLNGPRLVRLSPNWAAPILLPGESAFLTLTENRYVAIPGTGKTANCSYIERWDAQLQKIRYARPNTAAICYGASIYRPERTPAVIGIRQNAD